MVLLEAMFCGNALISYDCNYGPSDIINQNNGFLIPLNNQSFFIEKLSSVVENNTRLNDLIKTSFKDSEKWKKETALKEWKTILNF